VSRAGGLGCGRRQTGAASDSSPCAAVAARCLLCLPWLPLKPGVDLPLTFPLLLISPSPPAFHCSILFNYTILRDTKDVLVVTAPGSGAEIIPFLKTWVNLPMAIGFTVLYTKVGAAPRLQWW
jgi:AAA family ATP:ADP antiporter